MPDPFFCSRAEVGDGARVVADWAGAVDAASPAGVCGVKAFGDRPHRRHLDPARRGARRGRFITPRL